MKLGRVELKKIKVALSMSRETLAFTCDVYLDKKLLGEATNSGNGECSHLRFRNETEVLQEILNHYDFKDEKDFYTKHTSEIFDKIINDYQNQKDLDKLLKKQVNSIILSKDDAYYTSKFNFELKDAINNPVRIKIIQDYINKQKSNGFEILNTNLDFLNI